MKKMIEPQKVKHFIILHEFIAKHLNGIQEANAAIDLDDTAYIDMVDDYKLSKNDANKILIIYTSIKSKQVKKCAVTK